METRFSPRMHIHILVPIEQNDRQLGTLHYSVYFIILKLTQKKLDRVFSFFQLGEGWNRLEKLKKYNFFNVFDPFYLGFFFV